MRRILVDECINPRLAPRIRSSLPRSSVDTVRDLGWAGQKDHVPIPRIEGKTSISQNTNGSSAPAFVFEQWKALTDPAVTRIP
jgi:hypothetical protein